MPKRNIKKMLRQALTGKAKTRKEQEAITVTPQAIPGFVMNNRPKANALSSYVCICQ